MEIRVVVQSLMVIGVIVAFSPPKSASPFVVSAHTGTTFGAKVLHLIAAVYAAGDSGKTAAAEPKSDGSDGTDSYPTFSVELPFRVCCYPLPARGTSHLHRVGSHHAVGQSSNDHWRRLPVALLARVVLAPVMVVLVASVLMKVMALGSCVLALTSVS